MTKLLVVCLGVILMWPAAETFSLADRVGDPSAPLSFFLFSTSAGNYTIRHDGMGEVAAKDGRRRVFFLKVSPKGRIEHLYFLEHEGDLWLRYDVIAQGSYFMRMDQKKRKPVWSTGLISNLPDEAPTIKGDALTVGDTILISKEDGRIVRQN